MVGASTLATGAETLGPVVDLVAVFLTSVAATGLGLDVSLLGFRCRHMNDSFNLNQLFVK
jgi:hypothetical protein